MWGRRLVCCRINFIYILSALSWPPFIMHRKWAQKLPRRVASVSQCMCVCVCICLPTWLGLIVCYGRVCTELKVSLNSSAAAAFCRGSRCEIGNIRQNRRTATISTTWTAKSCKCVRICVCVWVEAIKEKQKQTKLYPDICRLYSLTVRGGGGGRQYECSFPVRTTETIC